MPRFPTPSLSGWRLHARQIRRRRTIRRAAWVVQLGLEGVLQGVVSGHRLPTVEDAGQPQLLGDLDYATRCLGDAGLELVEAGHAQLMLRAVAVVRDVRFGHHADAIGELRHLLDRLQTISGAGPVVRTVASAPS